MIGFPPLTVPNVISAHALSQPDTCAVICDGRAVTWRELVGRIHKVANALRVAGLEKGESVCLLLNNSIEMLELMLGTVKAGGVIAPLSPLMSQDSVAHMVRHAEARFLAAAADTVKHIRPVRDSLGLEPDRLIAVDFEEAGWTAYEPWLASASDDEPDVAIGFEDSISILYTSGTTGTPKGMEHSHFSRLLYPLVLGKLLKIDDTSRAILATPMCHNGTWIPMLPALYAGGSLVILRKFTTVDFLAAVERDGGTHTFLVPSQLNLLVDDAALAQSDCRSLRLIELAGSPLPTSTFEKARRVLSHVELIELYGMAEGFMTYIGPEDYAKGKIGSVGRPISSVNTDIRLLDEADREVPRGSVGEVVGRSALLLKGYHNDPELTRQSIWIDDHGREFLRSGDLARFDEDGYLHLVGRKKDVIISGGVNVYAVDIEDVFMRHPDVQAVAVIGIPDEKWGESPLLLAIMHADAKTTEEELKAWGNARVGKTQRVASVEFRDSFPRNTLDKILKRELREPYWRGRERDI